MRLLALHCCDLLLVSLQHVGLELRADGQLQSVFVSVVVAGMLGHAHKVPIDLMATPD